MNIAKKTSASVMLGYDSINKKPTVQTKVEWLQ